MKIDDINVLRERAKTAAESWAGGKIDELFKNRAQMRVIAKNAVRNLLDRNDVVINKYVGWGYMLLADENGEIDTDTMVGMFADMLDEVQPATYAIGPVDMQVGQGKVAFVLPKNMLVDMLVGVGRVEFTKEDILEFKNLLN